MPRIVLASLLGFLAGQFLNAYVLVKIKQRTREGKLWARLVGSTLVGEAADTVVFCLVAFGGILTGSTLAQLRDHRVRVQGADRGRSCCRSPTR